ncbi:hypothetical protein AAG570_005634 [Ranatra chinensis]|uniref:Uncharacterized protein n=1 Tax=Ranatra chinensis TaxID=642074 RepID=A0ABD0XXZ6_9HEMI
MDDEGVGGGDLGHDVEAGGARERNEGEGEGDRPDDPGEALELELNRRHFGAAPPAYRHTRNPSPEVSRTDLAACVCQYAWMSSEQLRAIPKQIDPQFVSTSEMTENEMNILYDSWLHLRRDKLTCGSVWFMS